MDSNVQIINLSKTEEYNNQNDKHSIIIIQKIGMGSINIIPQEEHQVRAKAKFNIEQWRYIQPNINNMHIHNIIHNYPNNTPTPTPDAHHLHRNSSVSRISAYQKHYQQFQHTQYRKLRNTMTGQELNEYQFYFRDSDQYHQFMRICLHRSKHAHHSLNKQNQLTYLRPYNNLLNSNNIQDIVQIQYISQHHSKQLCGIIYQVKIYIENFPLRLSHIKDISFPQNLYVLLRALRGFKLLFQLVGFFHITQDLICINQEGIVRVWVNQNLGKSLPSLLYMGNQAYISSSLNNLQNSAPLTKSISRSKSGNLYQTLFNTCNQVHYSTTLIDSQYKLTKPIQLFNRQLSVSENPMVWEIITIIEQLTNTQTIPNNYSFIDFLINENSSELSFNKAIELVYKYAEQNDCQIPQHLQSVIRTIRRNKGIYDSEIDVYGLKQSKIRLSQINQGLLDGRIKQSQVQRVPSIYNKSVKSFRGSQSNHTYADRLKNYDNKNSYKIDRFGTIENQPRASTSLKMSNASFQSKINSLDRNNINYRQNKSENRISLKVQGTYRSIQEKPAFGSLTKLSVSEKIKQKTIKMNSLNNSKCDSKDSATRKSKNIDKNTIEMSKREKSIKNENALIGHRKQQKQKANPEKNNSTLNIKKKCMVKDFKQKQVQSLTLVGTSRTGNINDNVSISMYNIKGSAQKVNNSPTYFQHIIQPAQWSKGSSNRHSQESFIDRNVDNMRKSGRSGNRIRQTGISRNSNRDSGLQVEKQQIRQGNSKLNKMYSFGIFQSQPCRTNRLSNLDQYFDESLYSVSKLGQSGSCNKNMIDEKQSNKVGNCGIKDSMSRISNKNSSIMNNSHINGSAYSNRNGDMQKPRVFFSYNSGNSHSGVSHISNINYNNHGNALRSEINNRFSEVGIDYNRIQKNGQQICNTELQFEQGNGHSVHSADGQLNKQKTNVEEHKQNLKGLNLQMIQNKLQKQELNTQSVVNNQQEGNHACKVSSKQQDQDMLQINKQENINTMPVSPPSVNKSSKQSLDHYEKHTKANQANFNQHNGQFQYTKSIHQQDSPQQPSKDNHNQLKLEVGQSKKQGMKYSHIMKEIREYRMDKLNEKGEKSQSSLLVDLQSYEIDPQIALDLLKYKYRFGKIKKQYQESFLKNNNQLLIQNMTELN